MHGTRSRSSAWRRCAMVPATSGSWCSNQAACSSRRSGTSYSPYEDVTKLYDRLPAKLLPQLKEPAFSMEYVTFGGWHDGKTWTLRGNATGPMQEQLEILTGDPEKYRAYAASYFEVDVPSDAIAHVLAGKKLDAKLLNATPAREDSVGRHGCRAPSCPAELLSVSAPASSHWITRRTGPAKCMRSHWSYSRTRRHGSIEDDRTTCPQRTRADRAARARRANRRGQSARDPQISNLTRECQVAPTRSRRGVCRP